MILIVNVNPKLNGPGLLNRDKIKSKNSLQKDKDLIKDVEHLGGTTHSAKTPRYLPTSLSPANRL